MHNVYVMFEASPQLQFYSLENSREKLGLGSFVWK